MHAAWNLMARGQRHRAHTFLFRKTLVIVLAGVVPAVIADWHYGFLPAKALLCAAGGGTFAGIYFFALAESYMSADFTSVYPVARGLPVMMVGLGDVLRGRFPSAEGWLGLAMVAFGCLFAPLKSFKDFHPRAYFHRSMAWILLVAATTVGFTMIDKAAAEIVSAGPASAARYVWYFFLFALIASGIMLRIFKPAGSARDGIWRVSALGAVFDYGGYWLVLWAYQMTDKASYVLAFRQISIVIGVVAAFAIYRETGRAARIAGALLITAGLIVITLFG